MDAEIEISDLDLETSFITFAEEELSMSLYGWQANVLEAFDTASEGLVQVSLATPNGSGKSSIIIPALVYGWLSLYPRGRVVATSADSKQLDNQIMPALDRYRGRFPDWKFIERQIDTPTGGRFFGFTCTEAGRAEGFHKGNDIEAPLLIIADEAKTIDESIFSALDRCTYNAILLTSSPGKMAGRFYETQFRPELGYYAVRVGLTECPHIGPEKVQRIIAQHGPNSPFTRSALHGEFIELWDGKPVYYAYSMEKHEHIDLPWPKGAYLVRGWDFGTNNAVIWSAYWVEGGCEYWWDLCEQYLVESDTDRQVISALARTEAEFPFHNDREQCSGVLDFCDPAGMNSSYSRQIKVTMAGKDTTVADSSVNIMRTHGIYPGMRTVARGLQETIAVVNRLMQKEDAQGRQCFGVDTAGCPQLTRGYRGGYRWPTATEPGFGSNVPLKGEACDNLDHPQDASRYGKINCLRLLQAEMAGTKPPLFAAKKKSINPARRL